MSVAVTGGFVWEMSSYEIVNGLILPFRRLRWTNRMPIEYKIDAEHCVVFSRSFGQITDQEFLQHQTALKSDPDFQPSFDHLLDYRIFVGNISADTVRRLAKDNPFGPGSRRAFVVSRELDFGMSRRFQQLSDESGHVGEIYWDIETGLEWLGVEESPF